jgi:hypothetical protein
MVTVKHILPLREREKETKYYPLGEREMQTKPCIVVGGQRLARDTAATGSCPHKK